MTVSLVSDHTFCSSLTMWTSATVIHHISKMSEISIKLLPLKTSLQPENNRLTEWWITSNASPSLSIFYSPCSWRTGWGAHAAAVHQKRIVPRGPPPPAGPPTLWPVTGKLSWSGHLRPLCPHYCTLPGQAETSVSWNQCLILQIPVSVFNSWESAWKITWSISCLIACRRLYFFKKNGSSLKGNESFDMLGPTVGVFVSQG